METEITITLNNCELADIETKETKDNVFVLLVFDKVSKELDVPEFVNRGRHGA